MTHRLHSHSRPPASFAARCHFPPSKFASQLAVMVHRLPK
jgi:hypothetical protein